MQQCSILILGLLSQGASEADIDSLGGSLSQHIAQPHSVDIDAVRSCDLQAACALPAVICQLAQLGRLCLDGCSNLVQLPNMIDQLARLDTLALDGCSSLAQLPDSIGQLTQLTELGLAHCGSLARLPDSIGQLVQLEWLQLAGCSSLAQLPDSISALTQLQSLFLQGCSKLALPRGLMRLSNPQCTIYAADCGFVETHNLPHQQVVQVPLAKLQELVQR